MTRLANSIAQSKKQAALDIKIIKNRVTLLQREEERIQFKIKVAKIKSEKIMRARDIASQSVLQQVEAS